MQTNEGGGLGESYEIRVKGHLNARWADWFDGLTLTQESDGTTLLSGPIVDQAALHGLALVPAGIVFAGIQPIHPPDVVESVTTTAWAIITSLKFAMSVLFVVGITGLYARQAEKAGLFGLLAFLVLATSWTLQTPFVFTEAFVLPPLAATAPAFVDAALGISYGHTGGVNLGVLPTLYSVGVGITYMLGGLLFGIATFRAGILPRVPAALLAIAATLTPLAALLPHAEQRYAAIPVALALAWLGYALWSETRVSASQVAPATTSAQLRPAAAK